MLGQQQHRRTESQARRRGGGGGDGDERLRAPAVVPEAVLGQPQRVVAEGLDPPGIVGERGIERARFPAPPASTAASRARPRRAPLSSPLPGGCAPPAPIADLRRRFIAGAPAVGLGSADLGEILRRAPTRRFEPVDVGDVHARIVDPAPARRQGRPTRVMPDTGLAQSLTELDDLEEARRSRWPVARTPPARCPSWRRNRRPRSARDFELGDRLVHVGTKIVAWWNPSPCLSRKRAR